MQKELAHLEASFCVILVHARNWSQTVVHYLHLYIVFFRWSRFRSIVTWRLEDVIHPIPPKFEMYLNLLVGSNMSGCDKNSQD